MSVGVNSIRKATTDRLVSGSAGRLRAFAAAAVTGAATGALTYRLLRNK